MPIQRFLTAQANGAGHGATYATALREMTTGTRCKQGHWIWYVLPQLPMQNTSELSTTYAIQDLEEAKEYLRHETLGPRYLAIITAIHTTIGQEKFGLTSVMGSTIDRQKLESSLILFSKAAKALSSEQPYAHLCHAIMNIGEALLECAKHPDRLGFQKTSLSTIEIDETQNNPRGAVLPVIQSVTPPKIDFKIAERMTMFIRIIRTLHRNLLDYSNAMFIPTIRRKPILNAIKLCENWNGTQPPITELYINLLAASRQMMEIDIRRYQNSVFSMHVFGSRFFNKMSAELSTLREKMTSEERKELRRQYESNPLFSKPLQLPKHYGFFGGFKKVVEQYEECVPSALISPKNIT